jgi:hypothetical protein
MGSRRKRVDIELEVGERGPLRARFTGNAADTTAAHLLLSQVAPQSAQHAVDIGRSVRALRRGPDGERSATRPDTGTR